MSYVELVRKNFSKTGVTIQTPYVLYLTCKFAKQFNLKNCSSHENSSQIMLNMLRNNLACPNWVLKMVTLACVTVSCYPGASDWESNQSNDQCAFQEQKVDAEHTKTKDAQSIKSFRNYTWRKQGLVSGRLNRFNKQVRIPGRIAVKACPYWS